MTKKTAKKTAVTRRKKKAVINFDKCSMLSK